MRFALGFLGFLIACNGAIAGDGASAPAEGPDAAAAGPSSSSVADPTDCVETRTQATGAASRTHLRLDASAGVISMFRDDGSRFLAWRYDDSKRLVTYVGFRQPQGTKWDEFQHDRQYDSHGNQIDLRLSYPTAANLDRPSDAATWQGERNENVYDPSGALLSSTRTAYGTGATASATARTLFHENAAQQCERLETDGAAWVETRSYDGQGRLSRVDTTSSAGAGNCSSSTWTKIWTYDDGGRPTLLREWCDGAAPTSAPGRVTTTTYRADGTERVEVIDRTSDLPGDYPEVTERSAYCAVIDAWRGGSPRDTHPAGTRCML